MMQRGGEGEMLTVNEEYAHLKSEYRLCNCGDSWGDAMHWSFTVADELYSREGFTPEHWKYKPSILGPSNDPDNYATQQVIEVGTDTLIMFGELLHRYCRLLRHLGKDY